MALLASQHFNVEVGLSLRDDAWAGARYWEGAADPTLTLDDLIARSDVAVVGIDGGGLDDLLGLAVIGRARPATGCTGTGPGPRPTCWTAQGHRRHLRDFEADGDLVICEHPTQDIEEVADICSSAARRWPPAREVRHRPRPRRRGRDGRRTQRRGIAGETADRRPAGLPPQRRDPGAWSAS
jgi:phage terminase large subunit-like protein